MDLKNSWYWSGGLFSRPRPPQKHLSRRREIALLEAYLEGDTPVFYLIGFGGVGKSYLLRELVWQSRGNRQVAWIECAQQVVTVEGFVSSIARACGNNQILELLKFDDGLISVGESFPLSNCIDICIDELEANNCLLILEDFHSLEVKDSTQLQFKFLKQLILGLSRTRVIISSRKLPALWDEVDLRRLQESTTIHGFSKEETHQFISQSSVILNNEQIDRLWMRTGRGIPQALELAMSRFKHESPQRVINDSIVGNHGFLNGWLEAQIKDLKLRARELLMLLAALRKPHPVIFCSNLWNADDFSTQLHELTSACLIGVTDSEIVISDIFREYMSDESIAKHLYESIHIRVAEHFQFLSVTTRQPEWLVEAIWHYRQAGQDLPLLRCADKLRESITIDEQKTLLAQCDEHAAFAAQRLHEVKGILQWVSAYGRRLSLGENIERGIGLLEEARGVARIHGSSLEQFQITRYLALAYQSSARYPDACNCHETCIEIARDVNNILWELEVLPELGTAQMRTERFVDAEATLNKAILLAEKSNQHRIHALAMAKLSRLQLKHKPIEYRPYARQLMEKSRLKFAELGDKRGLAEVYSLCGDYHRYCGETDLALEAYTQACRLTQELGLRAQETINVGQLAFLMRDSGRYQEALEYCLKAHRLNFRFGNSVGKHMHLVLMAELKTELGQHAEAYPLLEEAISSCSKNHASNRLGYATAYRALGRYYLSLKDYSSAKGAFEQMVLLYTLGNAWQYAKEANKDIARVLKGWSLTVSYDQVWKEFTELVLNTEQLLSGEKSLVLAGVILERLDESLTPRTHANELVECLEYREDIPSSKWNDGLLEEWIGQWRLLDTQLFIKLLEQTSEKNRDRLYARWLTSCAIRHDEESALLAISYLEKSSLSREDKFILLEVLESMESSRVLDSLALIYETQLRQEIRQSISRNHQMPQYTLLMRRSLCTLNYDLFTEVNRYLEEKFARVYKAGIGGENENPIPLESIVNLSDKRIALIGGQSKVRMQVRVFLMENYQLQDFREIAPSWEEYLNTKKVSHAIREADLVVVVADCMKHDTTRALDAAIADDTAFKCSRVRYSRGDGKSSIIQVVTEFFA